MTVESSQVESRARQSAGISNDAIYRMVQRALRRRRICGGEFLDVGCGAGNLARYVAGDFDRYVGADVVRYDDLPPEIEFCRVDLDSGRVPLPDGAVNVATAVETIEHLENPRALMRELVRLARPGGWVLVTTPNQLSVLSLLSLVVKQRFVHFQDVHYPTHLSALLEVDLRRMASECGLADVAVEYSASGRMPLTPLNYPAPLARTFPRAFSDNLLLVGRKPEND